MKIVVGILIALALCVSACDDNSPAAPTPTPVGPTMTESFAGTLNAGTFRFFSFSVVQYGNVNVTLNGATSAGDPSIQVGLGLGSPNAQDCRVTSSITTAAGATAQLTNVFSPGVYCVRIFDTGTLSAPATFDISIAHP